MKRYISLIYDTDDIDIFSNLVQILEAADARTKICEYTADPRHAANNNGAIRKAQT